MASGRFAVGLTLEDEFTMRRVTSKVNTLPDKEKVTFLVNLVYRFVCRERAYKATTDRLGVIIDTNVTLFDEGLNSD